MPLSPTPVEVEGLFAYARVSPAARRASDREVVVTASEPPPDARRTAGLRSELGWVLPVETEVHGVVRADRIAARLASLAAGALRRASFEQIAMESQLAADALTESSERALEAEGPRRTSNLPDEPSIPHDAAVVGLSRVRASHELCSWEILAIDRGPWLDVPAILGLLNTMLRHGRSSIRYAVLRGDDATARVLAAPMELIETAVAEGRIELEGLDDALVRSFGDEALDDLPADDAP